MKDIATFAPNYEFTNSRSYSENQKPVRRCDCWCCSRSKAHEVIYRGFCAGWASGIVRVRALREFEISNLEFEIHQAAAGLLGSKAGMVWPPFLSLLVSLPQRITPKPSTAVTGFLLLLINLATELSRASSPPWTKRNYCASDFAPSMWLRKNRLTECASHRLATQEHIRNRPNPRPVRTQNESGSEETF